jgi:hypothetical protein
MEEEDEVVVEVAARRQHQEKEKRSARKRKRRHIRSEPVREQSWKQGKEAIRCACESCEQDENTRIS